MVVGLLSNNKWSRIKPALRLARADHAMNHRVNGLISSLDYSQNDQDFGLVIQTLLVKCSLRQRSIDLTISCDSFLNYQQIPVILSVLQYRRARNGCPIQQAMEAVD